jgi:hypothetical protein
MRPKFILWLSVAVLSLTWYLIDPEATLDGSVVDALRVDQLTAAHTPGN